MYGDGWYRARSRGRSWAPVIVFGLGTLLLMGVAINMLLAGTGVIYDSSEPRGTKSILESFIWLAVAVACLLAAVHFEHRARGLAHGRIGAGVEAAASGARGYLPAGRGVFRRHGPTSTLVGGIVFTLIGAGIVFAAFQSHTEAARSSYTQANGVSETATVTSVDNEQSCGRYSCHYYSSVTVALTAPVGGLASTVVHVPDSVSYSSGQSIAVLVDPKAPGYAELPGSPYESSSDTILMGIFAALLLVLGITGIVRGLRMRGRQRAWPETA